MAEIRATAQRIAGASIGSGLTTIWSAGLGLVTSPILIHALGAPQYGMFALIGVVSGYLANLEFGFGHATVRFFARAHASGDSEEQRAVFGTGLAVFLIAALIACSTTFFGVQVIVHDFAHGPTTLHQTFIDAVRLGAPIIAISMLSSFVAACLSASQCFRPLIVTSFVVGTLLSVSAITIVSLGGGLVDVIAAQLVLNAAVLVIYTVALTRASPVTLRPRFNRGTFTAMARYSLWLMLAGVAGQTMLQGPPLVLAAYKTTSEVAAFAVANSVLQQLTGLVGATGLGFLPFVSAASLEGDHEPVRLLYTANLRLTVLVLAPVVTFIAVFAHPLLATWIGSGFANRATDTLRYMVIASLFLGCSSAPGDLLRGFGRPALVTTYSVIVAVAVVALACVLVPAQGAAGAALALCAGIGIVTVPFVFAAAILTVRLRPSTLLRSMVEPIIALAIAAALYECGNLIDDTFLSAVITGFVGTAIYVALAAKAFVDERERRVLLSLVSRLRRSAASSNGVAGSE